MLHTLLFVHGFWSYRRISYMVNFMCYKALFFSTPCFLFGIHSRFSTQFLWDQYNFFLFNVCYTATPIMIIAILDQALPRRILENNVLAFKAQKNKHFSPKIFAAW